MLRGSPSHQRRPARMADTTLHLTDTSFDTEIGKHKEVLMVDFWAEWCHPCRAIAPTLEELAQESKGSVSLAKVNVDDNPQLAERYIPAISSRRGGRGRDGVVGAAPKPHHKKRRAALAWAGAPMPGGGRPRPPLSPSREEFPRISAGGNLVPVYAEVAADLDTPL